jgi:VWFA-related protein
MPNDFRILSLFDLIANAKISGEEKVDGRPAFIIEGTLLEQPLKLWIDKNQYLILKSYRRVAFGDREEEATIQYKPKLNGEVPPEDLIPRPNQLAIGDGVVYQSAPLNSPKPPVLAPRLQKFGSSLGRNPGERAATNGERAATDEDVVRIQTDLVVCTALVVDPQGKIVRGLTKEDFVVKEDDKLQEIASLSMGDNKDLPRSIVLIIDYSRSQLPYIKTSIESAKMLVDKLNPKDRMAVVTDDVKLLVDFTSDRQLLKSQLEGLKSSALSGMMGASEQYDALLATLNELFDNEDTRPIIIFQTDGDQLDALKDGLSTGYYFFPRRYGFKDLLTAAEKSRATVYSVISGVKFLNVTEEEVVRRAHLDWDNRQNASYEIMRARNISIPKGVTVTRPDPGPKYFIDYGNQWVRRQTSLVNMAQFTGTLPEFLEDPGQADDIYNRILNDIDRRYVIGYYPTNRARDGKRRKVSIEVRNHPEYMVWGQKAYFAREEK